jgi:hypothetical protein
MNRQGHEEVTFFIGGEVEKTPAFSKKTLFVVGKPTLEQIEKMAKEYKTPHVFMGANHSFTVGNLDPYWDHVITALLDKGFWVTLDYQAHEHEEVLNLLNQGIWQCRTFVPLLGVRIPNVQTSSPNLTIKIDDVDFNATNPGVWCLHHHEITDSNRFTGWEEYGTDQVVAPLAGPAHTLPLKIATVAGISVNEVGLKIKVTEPDNTDSIIQNPQDLGLDVNPTTALKPDPAEEVITKVLTPTTPDSAAEAYADGAGEKAAKAKAKPKK